MIRWKECENVVNWIGERETKKKMRYENAKKSKKGDVRVRLSVSSTLRGVLDESKKVKR